MKCYYEELSVPRDASDADIKTAYRKLALRWHPDKNPDSSEDAKERFQLIQQAYEVLSDAQERAWYDNHREQILRGKNSDYEENCLDLYQYFTVSCYKGYGDEENGFYAVYREVFAKIAAEDAEFCDNAEEMAQVPTFGKSQCSYEEVVGPFYAYWQAYCTKKTYTWLCPYDIQEIKDRRVLRIIEKDLKKVVTKAKRERNEEVRQLVAFVRKRDRRVHAYRQILEERAALNRQKQEQNRLEQIRKRQRELQEMRQSSNHTFNEGYEEQLKQLEEHYGSDSSASDDENASVDEDDEAPGEEFDDLYCVACNKAFTNDRAFANHKTSKKHRENIEKLKMEMELEEDAHNEEAEEDDEVESIPADEDESLEEFAANTEDDDDELIELNTEDEAPPDMKQSLNRKQKISKKVTDIVQSSEAEDKEDEIKTGDEESSVPQQNQQGKQKLAKKNKNAAAEEILIESSTDDKNLLQNQGKQNRKQRKSKKGASKTNVPLLEANSEQEEEIVAQVKTLESSDNEDWHSGTGKKSTRKQKNKIKQAKKPNETITTAPSLAINKDAAETQQATEAPTTSSAAETNVSSSTPANSHVCATCKSCFDSKNKLFAHLKKTNHGVYLPREKPTEATTNNNIKSNSKKTAKSKRK